MGRHADDDSNRTRSRDTAASGVHAATDTPPDLLDAAVWARTIDACDPATLEVITECRMGDLRLHESAGDVLQEAMLRAWQSRTTLIWRGQRAFRSWLLTIIDHTIADLRDRHTALKRGGGVHTHRLPSDAPTPNESATPSRVALRSERAHVVRAALLALPDDLRDIVRLRVLEQCTIPQIAAQTGLTAATVQHRVRRGAALYRDRLHEALASSVHALPTPPQAALGPSQGSVS